MQEAFIPFSQKRWQTVLATYESWWNNILDRPIFNISWTRDSDGKNPPGRLTSLSSYSLDVPVEVICQDVAWALSRCVDGREQLIHLDKILAIPELQIFDGFVISLAAYSIL